MAENTPEDEDGERGVDGIGQCVLPCELDELPKMVCYVLCVNQKAQVAS